MDQNTKRRVMRRLRIVSGQVRGLERMLSEDKYCIDIIHQSLAVKEALSSFEDLMLRNHLSTHVAEQFKSGKAGKAIQEILSVYALSKKR